MQLAQHENAVRERAYAIWEQEGRPDGREWDHWERASHEILSRGIPAAALARAEQAAVAAKVRTSARRAGGGGRKRKTA